MSIWFSSQCLMEQAARTSPRTQDHALLWISSVMLSITQHSNQLKELRELWKHCVQCPVTSVYISHEKLLPLFF